MTNQNTKLVGSIVLPIVSLALFLLVLFLYNTPKAESEGILVVNKTADTNDGNCNANNCTLREAILAANDSPGDDIINFSLPDNAVITLSGESLPIITETLTIEGGTAVNLTISGDDASRVFVIGEEPPFYPGLKKANGEDRGLPSVTIRDLAIINGNDDYGGAIFNAGILLLENIRLDDSYGIYGTIYNEFNLTVNGSSFSSNVSKQGGGVFYNTRSGSLAISNSTFTNNASEGGWKSLGGVLFNGPGFVTIVDSTFRGNQSTNPGARGYGGVIYNQNSSTISIEGSTFENNISTRGGAIYNVQNSRVTITNSTFEGNSSDYGNGGAIDSSGFLTILNSTLNNNSAVNDGGALYLGSTLGLAVVSNSTLYGNSAMEGGAIFQDSGTLTMTNSTLSQNSAVSGSGIITKRFLHMSNTLIGNGINSEDCDSSLTLSTNVNNLIEDGSCNAQFYGFPLLGPLQNNGGPTWTVPLLDGSPALDRGDPATCAADPVNDLDQRGYGRPVDGDGDEGAICDIGAFERQSPYDGTPTILMPVVLNIGQN